MKYFFCIYRWVGVSAVCVCVCVIWSGCWWMDYPWLSVDSAVGFSTFQEKHLLFRMDETSASWAALQQDHQSIIIRCLNMPHANGASVWCAEFNSVTQEVTLIYSYMLILIIRTQYSFFLIAYALKVRLNWTFRASLQNCKRITCFAFVKQTFCKTLNAVLDTSLNTNSLCFIWETLTFKYHNHLRMTYSQSSSVKTLDLIT